MTLVTRSSAPATGELVAARRPDRAGAAYTAALLAVIGWGSLFPVTKPALQEVTPLMIACVRAGTACLVLGGLTCWRAGGLRQGWVRLRVQARRGGRDLVLLGLLSFAATSLLALGAQQYLPASVNGVLNNLAPLWLAVYASLAGRARSAALLLAGSLVAALGVAAIFLGDAWMGVGPGAGVGGGGSAPGLGPLAWLGVLLSVTGSVLIAASNVLGRRVMAGQDPIASTAVGAAAGAVPLFVLLSLGIGGNLAGFAGVSVSTVAALAWLGTMSTAFNFTLWFYALSHLPVTRVAPLQYLIAPLSVGLAVVFLGEAFGPGLLAGLLAIIAGITLAQRGAEPLR